MPVQGQQCIVNGMTGVFRLHCLFLLGTLETERQAKDRQVIS